MTNNTKELVAAGHALVKEMATLATDHKCFNSAELVRELATQLDVQRARSDLLAADNEKALSVLKEANESVLRAKGTIDGLVVENAYLLPKAASELSNAWMLYKYWVGINAALMHIWSGRLPDAVAWLENTVSGPGIDVPRITDSAEIEKWAADQQKDSISHAQALEIIKAETPATALAAVTHVQTPVIKLPKLPVLGSNAEWYQGYAAGAKSMRNDCAAAIHAACIVIDGEQHG